MLARLLRNTNNEVVGIANILLWWKQNENLYPHLDVLARRVLSIRATSAPSERIFSSAGLTIANDRASLLPELAGSLVFLRDAWKLVEELNTIQLNLSIVFLSYL